MSKRQIHETISSVWGYLKLQTHKESLWQWAIICIGTILRLRQYLANRSLWGDEASLALNIVNRTWAGLTLPLDYNQGAPVLFLFIEKSLITVMGNRDYILRLFPFISGLLALYLIHRFTREYIGNAGMFAVLLLAISAPMISYSSELKQYSCDAAVGLALVYFASRCVSKGAQKRDFFIMGVVGALAIWVSHPSVFFLAGIGLTLVLQKAVDKTHAPMGWIIGMGTSWAVSFGLLYFVSLQYLTSDDYLLEYWSKAFAPMPPWNNLGWYFRTCYSLLFISFFRTDWILAVIFLLLVGMGVLSFYMRDWKLALILTFPFFAVMAASALQKYPLKDRFMLFLVPLVFILATEGLNGVYSIFAKRNRVLALILPALPILVTLWLITPGAMQNFMTPYLNEDIKSVLHYVSENRKPNDMVYVFHDASYAFSYYASQYDMNDANVIVGIDAPKRKASLQRFFADIEALRGKERIWFIFTEVYGCGECEGDKQQYYVDYLNDNGIQIDVFHAWGANAYLYDFNP